MLYEANRIGKHTLYLKGYGNVGVYETPGGGACVIDSGYTEDDARAILGRIEQMGRALTCLIGTHAHPDHIGGFAYMQEKTGCPVLMHGAEIPIARWSELQLLHLYGAFPYARLRNPILAARDIPDVREICAALPAGLEMTELPGHFLDMIGIKTDDDIFFIADSVFSRRAIEKLHILYIYDVAAFLDTLSMLERTEAKLFVPAHSAPTDDLSSVIEANRRMVDNVSEMLLDICSSPMIYSVVLKETLRRFGLTANDNSYFLTGSTVRSYLSWLSDRGMLDIEVTPEGEMFFRAR